MGGGEHKQCFVPQKCCRSTPTFTFIHKTQLLDSLSIICRSMKLNEETLTSSCVKAV